jgi:hypothetical protein
MQLLNFSTPAALVVSSVLVIPLIDLLMGDAQRDSIRRCLFGERYRQTDYDPRAQQLQEKEQILFRCTEAKAAVAWDLAGGGLTLFEAASKTHEIDLQNPYFNWEEFRRGTPGSCDGERSCREVIACLCATLPQGPENKSLVARYEAELQEHLDRGTLPQSERDAAESPK